MCGGEEYGSQRGKPDSIWPIFPYRSVMQSQSSHDMPSQWNRSETQSTTQQICLRHQPTFSCDCPRLSVQSTGYSRQQAELVVTVSLTNHSLVRETSSTLGPSHTCVLLVGDTEDNVLCKQRIR